MAENVEVTPHTEDEAISEDGDSSEDANIAGDNLVSENEVFSKDASISEDTVIQCRYCQHFREEPWETGYCRRTHMYVLETFSCDKFVRNVPEPE